MILKVDMLNQQAYDILKEKIIKKELLPGTRLHSWRRILASAERRCEMRSESWQKRALSSITR